MHNSCEKEKGNSGASAVEYGLLVALIAAVIVGAITFLGGDLSEKPAATKSSAEQTK